MRNDSHPWQITDPSSSSRSVTGCAQALILMEAADFAGLRRLIGLSNADTLALRLAERAAAVLPAAEIATVGRNLVEIGLAVAGELALSEAVAALHDSADQPIVINGTAYPLRLHVGAALTDGHDGVLLAEAAEEALLRARATAGQSVAKEPQALSPDKVIGDELLTAVTNGELFLQYQPKLHLRRQEITSLEALIRWRHPQRGLILPGDFIPAAERSGAIKPMTLWTMRQVIADQRTLARNGHDLPVFINIAGVLLSDDDFVSQACKLVLESGAKLGFEITETSVIRRPEMAIKHLQRFAEIGVVITIDDYGAGLSSLAYLKQLPARELKIDKLFVTQLSSSHRDPLIVRSTIDLAHALEMEVVAEGVETPTSLALLSVMGCDLVQGFLISRPLGLEAMLSYLDEGKHRGLVEQSRSPLQRLSAVRARA